jgi:hypothetical protein
MKTSFPTLLDLKERAACPAQIILDDIVSSLAECAAPMWADVCVECGEKVRISVDATMRKAGWHTHWEVETGNVRIVIVAESEQLLKALLKRQQ